VPDENCLASSILDPMQTTSTAGKYLVALSQFDAAPNLNLRCLSLVLPVGPDHVRQDVARREPSTEGTLPDVEPLVFFSSLEHISGRCSAVIRELPDTWFEDEKCARQFSRRPGDTNATATRSDT
jgi:hypothetical protein